MREGPPEWEFLLPPHLASPTFLCSLGGRQCVALTKEAPKRGRAREGRSVFMQSGFRGEGEGNGYVVGGGGGGG